MGTIRNTYNNFRLGVPMFYIRLCEILTFRHGCRCKDGAAVSFATTRQAWTRNGTTTVYSVEGTLPVTGLTRQFQALGNHINGVDRKRSKESKVPSHHILFGRMLFTSLTMETM